jgi:polyphosphate glucokinase
MMEILGIDIGGSGLKGAIVDTNKGELVSERFRIPTPQPADPNSIVKTFKAIKKHFNWSGIIGCGFPAVVQHEIVRTASNIDKSWIGTNIVALFQEKVNNPVFVLNDADAAGIAEMRFGAGLLDGSVVVIITVGTGIGSALFIEGILYPNTEFGQFTMNGKTAEKYAADAVRKNLNLSWKKWAKRFNEYLAHLEMLLWPDVIIVGGSVSKKFYKFEKYLTINTEVIPAKLLNNAGIIGAAIAAEEKFI